MILKIDGKEFESQNFICQLTIDGGADVNFSVPLSLKSFFIKLHDNKRIFTINSGKWILNGCYIKIFDIDKSCINISLGVKDFKIKTIQENRDDIISDILDEE
jgi:hypothetical protein